MLAVPTSLLIRRALDGVEGREPLSRGPAPQFTLTSVDGHAVSLSDVAGRPVVLNFWGSYCADCRLALLRLADARARHPELALVGVVFRDRPEQAREEAATTGADWPHLVDPDGEVARAYGVDGAPVTFFIGRDGDVAGHLVGRVTDRLVERQLGRIL